MFLGIFPTETVQWVTYVKSVVLEVFKKNEISFGLVRIKSSN